MQPLQPLVPHSPVIAPKILLIDDDELSRELVSLAIFQLGYQNDLATSGARGVTAAAKQHYDLIFLDIVMPGMNGYEVASAIREVERLDQTITFEDNKALICAITTLYNEEETRRLCLESSMNWIIRKPCSRPDLLCMIKMTESLLQIRAQEQYTRVPRQSLRNRFCRQMHDQAN